MKSGKKSGEQVSAGIPHAPEADVQQDHELPKLPERRRLLEQMEKTLAEGAALMRRLDELEEKLNGSAPVQTPQPQGQHDPKP
jgi:hypothetical protein